MAAKAGASTKKIKPYPIDVELEGPSKRNAEIVYLTSKGIIARFKAADMVNVGEEYVVAFNLPVMRHRLHIQVKVVKTYDRAVDPKNHVIERLAEFHFENLSDQQKKYILSFLTAIRQKHS